MNDPPPPMVHLAQRVFIDCDGTVYPITNWYDADGDECEPGEAVGAVAGTEGRWFAIRLREFEREAVQ